MKAVSTCIIIWDDPQAVDLAIALKSRAWRVTIEPSLPLFAPLADTADLVVVDADMQCAYEDILDEVNPLLTDVIALSNCSTTQQLMKLSSQNVSVFVEKPIDVKLLAEAIDLSSYKNVGQSVEKPTVLAVNKLNHNDKDKEGKNNMKFISVLLSVLGITLGLTGCVGSRIHTEDIMTRPLGQEFDTRINVTEKKTTADATYIVPDILTLRDALALAITQNPGLKAFSFEIRAAEARTLQASLLPNPELEAEMAEFDRDGEGSKSSETVIGLGQLIELGGKRRWRTQVAAIEGELAGWDYEEKRLSIFAETAMRFAHALADERRLKLSESAVKLAKDSMKAVEARVKAGKEPPFHVSKASAEFEMAQLNVFEAKNNREVSRKKLASMWASEIAIFQSIEGNIDTLALILPTKNNVQSYLPQNPQIARWNAELRLRKAVLASEKATRIPDLELAVGFQQFEEDGTDSLAFGVAFPLPLFDRNQGGIAAARHNIAKATMQMKDAQIALSTELTETYTSLVVAHTKAKTLREKVLPASEKAFSTAREGYQQGKFGYLDVLDAQRTFFSVQSEVLEALMDYHGAVINLEQLTGMPLKKMINNKGDE